MKVYKLTEDILPLTASFECGNYVIDNFLKSRDALDCSQGVTYVMLTDDEKVIVGYYNIETGRIDQLERIGDTTSVTPIGGTININYLAIHSAYQHHKISEVDNCNIYLGDLLLQNCEQQILSIRKNVGFTFITLYSTEQGLHLYRRNGYEFFEDDMSTFIKERDVYAHKLYKFIDDIL